jgi:hypothetical protein
MGIEFFFNCTKFLVLFIHGIGTNIFEKNEVTRGSSIVSYKFQSCLLKAKLK